MRGFIGTIQSYGKTRIFGIGTHGAADGAPPSAGGSRSGVVVAHGGEGRKARRGGEWDRVRLAARGGGAIRVRFLVRRRYRDVPRCVAWESQCDRRRRSRQHRGGL